MIEPKVQAVKLAETKIANTIIPQFTAYLDARQQAVASYETVATVLANGAGTN